MDRFAVSITDGKNDYTFYSDSKEFMEQFSKDLHKFFTKYNGKIDVNTVNN